MDEEAQKKIGEWLCGKLNPPGWPILRIEVRAMMLDMYRQGKMEELQACIQAALEEHRRHTAYMESINEAEALRKRPIPEWVAHIPAHPVTLMRNALEKTIWPYIGQLNYLDDPKQHIFN